MCPEQQSVFSGLVRQLSQILATMCVGFKKDGEQDLLQSLRGGGVNKLTMFFLRIFVQKGKKGNCALLQAGTRQSK